MTSAKHYLVLLLAASLLFGSCSSRSLRQKRGIMKMMMHIMWDPVRLIRYWYAYDVTKEIAKSWRKIIPTMMFLPLTSNPSATPGIAKYVHPTYGLKESSHPKPVKSFPYVSGELYHIQDGIPVDHSDYSSMDMSPGASNKHVSNSGPFAHQHFIKVESKNGEHFPRFPITSKSKHTQDTPQVIWKSAQYGYEKDGNSKEFTEFSDGVHQTHGQIHHGQLAIPYEVYPDQNNARIVLKAVPISESNVDFPSSSSLVHNGEGIVKTSVNQLDQIPYHILMHHPGEEKDSRNETEAERPAHQEIHIVLHPIPISESGIPDYPKPAGSNYLPFKISQSSRNQQNSSPLLHQTPFIFFNEVRTWNKSESELKENDAVSNEYSTEKADDQSSESQRTSNIIWKLQNNSNHTNNFNSTKSDQDVEASDISLKSFDVSIDSSEGYGGDIRQIPQYPPPMNTYGINILQLKEDLKHGTPVFIPFNNHRNVLKKSTDPERNNHKMTMVNEDHDNRSASSKNKIIFPPNSSSELKDQNNHMQRMVLFIANKKPI